MHGTAAGLHLVITFEADVTDVDRGAKPCPRRGGVGSAGRWQGGLNSVSPLGAGQTVRKH
jgi:hypothetical protein